MISTTTIQSKKNDTQTVQEFHIQELPRELLACIFAYAGEPRKTQVVCKNWEIICNQDPLMKQFMIDGFLNSRNTSPYFRGMHPGLLSKYNQDKSNPETSDAPPNFVHRLFDKDLDPKTLNSNASEELALCITHFYQQWPIYFTRNSQDIRKKNPLALAEFADTIKERVLDRLKEAEITQQLRPYREPPDLSIITQLPSAIFSDEPFVLEMINANGDVFGLLPPNLKNEFSIALAAVQKNGMMLDQIGPELKDNIAIATAAIEKNCSAFQFVAEEIKDNAQIQKAYKDSKTCFDSSSSDESEA